MDYYIYYGLVHELIEYRLWKTSDANPKSDENLKSDDGFCEEVSSEIDVKSFYGTSKAKTKERKIEEGPSRNPHSTRSRKECPKCGVATTTGRFRRNRKCHGCEENDEKCARKESEDLCNSPTSDPKRLFRTYLLFIQYSRFDPKMRYYQFVLHLIFFVLLKEIEY